MELVIAISILSVISASGVAIFMRTIRASSQVQLRRNLDERARLILNNMTNFFYPTKVMSADGVDRVTCLMTGSVSANSVVLRNFDQLLTTISINGSGQIASASGATTVIVNPDGIVNVSAHNGGDSYFVWTCGNGVPDRLTFRFRAVVAGDQGDSGYSQDYSTDIVLRNSGN